MQGTVDTEFLETFSTAMVIISSKENADKSV